MKIRVNNGIALAGFLGFVCFAAGPKCSAQLYSIIDLGLPSTNLAGYSAPHGINANGTVVGEWSQGGAPFQRAFMYRDGTNLDLGTLSGDYAVAHGVNDTNVAVGETGNGFTFNPILGFAYTNGAMTNLGTLGGTYTIAWGVNSAGHAVGESSVSIFPNAPVHGVWYHGAITDLGALGGNYSSARGINDTNLIVGESTVVTNGVTNLVAFTYTTNTLMQALGTLGGDYGAAFAVNNSGQIVGESSLASGETHAFLYSAGTMQDLGTFGGNYSTANGINSAGDIAGYALTLSGEARAFLWSGPGPVDLNTRFKSPSICSNLISADGINDQGQITGSGYTPAGEYHAFLLTPAGALVVAITNPAPNSTFAAPATFDVGASVLDTMGTVTNVEFFVNGNPTGNSTSEPYGVTVSNLNAGNYTLMAVAWDDSGLTASNSIAISVTGNSPAAVAISNAIFAAGDFSFSFSTQPGFTYDSQFTTPLSLLSNNWLTFTSLVGNGSVVRVTNATPTDAQRYYRVLAH